MIQQFLTVFGGLALFIYGMGLMSEGLHRSAGDRMRSILRLFSANRFVAILSGAVVTCIIQSSSASTVMVIGFVNAGLLNLVQSIGIIFGANIGTTITAQLVAFNIQWLIMPSIFIGVLMRLQQKRRALSSWGMTVMGFGLLFLGMQVMGDQLKSLSGSPAFTKAFQLFSCTPEPGSVSIPFLSTLGAICVGMVATFIIQSSSACSGVVIVLAANGLIDLYTSVALILGSNIGTTITAQLAAIPANRVAKQAALAHTLFNFLGVILVLASFYIHIDGKPSFYWALGKISGDSTVQRQIANAHTLFNVFTTLVLSAFIPTLARICEAIIPVRNDEVRYKRLEPHLLKDPTLALIQTASALRAMLRNAWTMADGTLRMYAHNDEANQKIVRGLEERERDVDDRQADIADYLSKLMQQPLTPEQASQIPLLLHCSNDVERIGDHAAIIKSTMEHIQDKHLEFSEGASREFDELLHLLECQFQLVYDILADNSPERIQEATMRRSRLYEHLSASEQEHIARLSKGTCKPDVGLVFLELLSEMRKIVRHFSNITDRASKFYVRPGMSKDIGDATVETVVGA